MNIEVALIIKHIDWKNKKVEVALFKDELPKCKIEYGCDQTSNSIMLIWFKKKKNKLDDLPKFELFIAPGGKFYMRCNFDPPKNDADRKRFIDEFSSCMAYLQSSELNDVVNKCIIGHCEKINCPELGQILCEETFKKILTYFIGMKDQIADQLFPKNDKVVKASEVFTS